MEGAPAGGDETDGQSEPHDDSGAWVLDAVERVSRHGGPQEGWICGSHGSGTARRCGDPRSVGCGAGRRGGHGDGAPPSRGERSALSVRAPGGVEGGDVGRIWREAAQRLESGTAALGAAEGGGATGAGGGAAPHGGGRHAWDGGAGVRRERGAGEGGRSAASRLWKGGRRDQATPGNPGSGRGAAVLKPQVCHADLLSIASLGAIAILSERGVPPYFSAIYKD